MSFSARYLFAVLFVVFGLTVTVFAQSTTAQTSKVPRGTVSGRITIKDKGAPGVAVGLRKNEPIFDQGFLRATTDHDGFYRITNVPPGTYEVTPSAPAYVLVDANAGRGKSVIVGEDENVEGINFSLVRGGVVTGKVTDADGRPAIAQQINIFPISAFERSGRGDQPIYATSSAQTDDRGIYRAFGLRAGRYKVATGRGDDTFYGNYMTSRTAYRQVFHPDVNEHTKATIIEVTEGSEATNVDIKLGAVIQTFSVSGRLIDEKGIPVPNVRFGIQRIVGQRPEYTNSSMVSNALGEFLAEGLIPGKYGIYLFQNVSTDMRADTVSFDIIDEDITGLLVKLTKGASLSGVVVLESEDRAAFEQLLKLQVRAYVSGQGPSGFGQSSTSRIAADGSFRLPGLPGGTASLSLGAPGVPQAKGFAIARVERDGIVLPRGVEVKEGESVTGLRVIVSFGNAVIRGVVKLENGSLPSGMTMFVRVSKPGDTVPGAIRPAQVDARGHFLIEGIPSGAYELTLMVPGTSGSPSRRVKQDVSVQNGVTTDVVITVDLSAP